jgi:CRP-like cAMP-binding protein
MGAAMGKFSGLAERMGISFEAGETVFNEGDPGDAMYMVYEGTLDVSSGGGIEFSHLASLGPGEIFGEMALVDAIPRSATVIAAVDSIVIPITAEFLRENIRKDPKFIFQIIETLILRIDNTGQKLREKQASKGEGADLLDLTGDMEGAPDIMSFLRIFKGFADPNHYADFESGDIIFAEGDPGDLMFIILEGAIALSISVDGQQKAVSRMGRGDFFGESALITDTPRSAAATAAVPTTLFPVVRKDLMDGILGDPQAALQLVQILILRLRSNLKQLAKS